MNKKVLIVSTIIATTVALFFVSRKNEIHGPRGQSAENHFESGENALIIGTNAEFPPFTFKDNNEIKGLDIDVALEVAKRLGKKAVIKDMTFDALIPEIQLGHVHLIAAGMSPTETRAKIVDFAPTHFKGSPLVIISSTTQPMNSITDLEGKTVVVNEGYIADFYISEHSKINIIRLPTSLVSEGAMAVKSGRAHAFVAAEFSLRDYLKSEVAKDFHTAIIEESNEPSALALSKAHPELAETINKAMAEMEADGTLGKIVSTWNK